MLMKVRVVLKSGVERTLLVSDIEIKPEYTTYYCDDGEVVDVYDELLDTATVKVAD